MTRTLVHTLALLAVACAGGDAPATASPRSSLEGFFPGEGARLHFALDLPEGAGPFPAVLMGHGAGRSTKDETRFLVSFWHRQGYAVLRYDRRGAGQSTGTYVPLGSQNSETGVPELAGDMVAGVQFLKSRPDIRGTRIGLMGISQAGWIMVAAAERSRDVAFVVAAVGSTMPVSVNPSTRACGGCRSTRRTRGSPPTTALRGGTRCRGCARSASRQSG